jgi:hypothetical protein
MNEEQEDNEELDEDDLQAYLKDMENLETDFSDLDDLDLEEIKEMQDAIERVKEEELISETGEIPDESIQEEEIQIIPSEVVDIEPPPEISVDLEERIKQELLKKKEKEVKAIITPDKFLAYIKDKREKIWYHALYFLVFEVEDHIASKALLYDVLKEVTSKSPIDPIPEHQFYFGLGYILRLSLNDKKIIRYMSGGKFKINVSVNTIKELLEESGEPISTRPVIEEKEKKKMFTDFLKDDFLDI